MSIEQSADHLPQGITAVTENGLDAFRIETALGTVLVYANGAHVAEWTPAGADPVLWMSKHSNFQTGKAVRGGIPICFPWFGPGRAGDLTPAHGFARITPWTLLEAEADETGEARLALGLSGDQHDAEDFTARLDVTMGHALTVSLTVTAGTQPFDYEEALHTYLSVGDARKVSIDGLDQDSYLDKLDDQQKVQQGAVHFTSETDRVYLSTKTAHITDPVHPRRLRVEKTGSANTVIWNPWTDKAAAMPDFGAEEWPEMCCVETANCLGESIYLAPGESHTMQVRITSEDFDNH